MQMRFVKSSNIKAIGYDPATRTLRAQFASGGFWDYEDVSPEKHQRLLAADSDPKQSVGSLFHSSIKKAHKAKPYGKT